MKYIFIDERSSDEQVNELNNFGKVVKIPVYNKLYESIQGHVDILLSLLNDKEFLFHKDIDKTFVREIMKLGFAVKLTNNSLGEAYPKNIILNGVNLKNHFIHNLKYTDPILLDSVKGKTLINVKQGYSKCSVAIVQDNAIITSDISIAKELNKHSFDVLLLPPGDIILEGLNYGFIGGTCGLVDKDVLAFFGTLEKYAYGKEVKEFLKRHKVEPYFLSDTKLIDRGSILTASL